MTEKAPLFIYYCLLAALVVITTAYVALQFRSAGGSQVTSDLGFPFEVVSDRLNQEHHQRDVVVVLSKQYYSQDNLSAIFRSYAKKYKNQATALGILVYSDRKEALFLKQGNDEDQDNYSAIFTSTRLGSRGEPIELYSYYPNPDRRDERRMVALKGDPCNVNVTDRFIEKWETTNQGFNVRVISFEWEKVTPPGTYYAFQVCGIDEDDRERCHHIMTIRQDEVVPIPRQQIRFINDRIAYIFMGWKYAVTVDGGESWSVWDAEEELPGWKCCDSTLIRDVAIFPDGSGMMNLNQTLKNSAENLILQTKDYGQHWSSNVK